MNIEKVCNSAAFVNYEKPEMEMVEMEIESVLCVSFNTGDGNKDDDGSKPPVVDGGGGISGRSSRVRTKR